MPVSTNDVRCGASLSTSGGALARPDRFNLFQTHRYSADCGRYFGPDPRATQLQDHAMAILQYTAPAPSRNRTAGSNGAVGAFDRSWPPQIEGPSNKLS